MGYPLLLLLTSNVLGRLSRSQVDTSAIQKKGGPRDWAQVGANGVLAGGAALFYALGGGTLALVMFGASVAAATSDTWASEAGVLSRTPPVSITTFRVVPRGMSGGITWLGTMSSIVGSLVIALAWYATFVPYNDRRSPLSPQLWPSRGLLAPLLTACWGQRYKATTGTLIKTDYRTLSNRWQKTRVVPRC